MTQLKYIGSCLPLFVLAVVFDITGFVLLMLGVFGNVQRRGVFYGDFLIHTGALVIFSSLALWLMWYVGNIRVKEEDLTRRSSAAHGVKELARKLTERLSSTHLTGDTGEKTAGKSSTIRNVTWGKSTYFPGQKDPETDTITCDELSKEDADDQFMCFQNKGYEDEESSVSQGDDAPQEEKINDQNQTAEGPKSDVSDSNEASEEKAADEEFTCYQNEGYDQSESDTNKGEEPPQAVDQTEPESFDTLL